MVTVMLFFQAQHTRPNSWQARFIWFFRRQCSLEGSKPKDPRPGLCHSSGRPNDGPEIPERTTWWRWEGKKEKTERRRKTKKGELQQNNKCSRHLVNRPSVTGNIQLKGLSHIQLTDYISIKWMANNWIAIQLANQLAIRHDLSWTVSYTLNLIWQFGYRTHPLTECLL